MTSPLIRYHGGKWRIGQQIMRLFPPHSIYVEPFGGGAGILLQKPPAKIDVYNDLDGDIVNLFRVVRDYPEELARLIEWTPFSRAEFVAAYEDTDDPIERARRTLIRAFMGFGSASATKGKSGFRPGGDDGRPQYRWGKVPNSILDAARRLKKCIIEHLPYQDILKRYDSPETLFYLDPPYMHSTRTSVGSGAKYYRFEMSDEDHSEMLSIANSVEGHVVISGYASDLYDDALADWDRYTIKARASGRRGTVIREEVVWVKPHSMGLFGDGYES